MPARADPDDEDREGGQGGDDDREPPLSVALLIRKWSVRGGNERVATEVARLLCLGGHRVLVLCQKVDDSATALGLPVEVRTLAGLSFDPALAIGSFAFAARRAVRRLRAAGAVDVVLGFNHSVEQDVYRLGGGTHAAYLERRGQARQTVLDRLALRLERARLDPARFGRLIAPSRLVRDEVLAGYPVPPDRIDVVYNGVDLERFAPRPEDRGAVRRELGLPAQARVALFVGQELARKGFEAAVAAAGAVGATLAYVGQARRPPGLPEHVVWLGERRDVPRVHAAADALILPSRYDPFGGVVLEAYASGLPAVATRRVGATELAAGTPLEALLVDDPDEGPALAAALERALTGGAAVFGGAARSGAEARGLAVFGRDLIRVLRAARAGAPSPQSPRESGV